MGKNNQGDIDYCAYPRCRNNSDMIWLDVGVCNMHFAKICDMPIKKAYMVMRVSKQKIKENSEQCGCKN